MQIPRGRALYVINAASRRGGVINAVSGRRLLLCAWRMVANFFANPVRAQN